jgi:hypothetical protein
MQPAPRQRGGNRSRDHSYLLRGISEYLQLQHAWVLRVRGGIGQRAGVPDCLACLHGTLIAVEGKTGTARLSEDQMRERDALERAGALYIEARSIEMVEDALVAAGLWDMGRNGEATLQVAPRQNVQTGLWWELTWIGADGKQHIVEAQSLDVLVRRATEKEFEVGGEENYG